MPYPLHRIRTAATSFMLAFVMLTFASSSTLAEATPTASPAASPIATTGCEGLGHYFQHLADLTLDNEGLRILREAEFAILTLSEDDAATVIASLNELIPSVEAMPVPEPARDYHAVYVEMLGWYRAMATDRTAAAYQRLINEDRRLFSDMGKAILAGQTACGFATWNESREAAFPPEQ